MESSDQQLHLPFAITAGVPLDLVIFVVLTLCMPLLFCLCIARCILKALRNRRDSEIGLATAHDYEPRCRVQMQVRGLSRFTLT
ncbi:MAG: hypothetical protein SGPRY_007464 [Prymnesium sp.]